jgi:hypothetical protein
MKHKNIIVSIVLSLAIGFLIGNYFGKKSSRGWGQYLEFLEFAHYQAFYETMNLKGTIESKENALKGFIELTEKRKNQWTPTFSEETYAVDLSMSYLRLANLAKERGSNSEYESYMKKAESYCPKMGWQECNSKIIQDFTAEVDRNVRNRNGIP